MSASEAVVYVFLIVMAIGAVLFAFGIGSYLLGNPNQPVALLGLALLVISIIGVVVAEKR